MSRTDALRQARAELVEAAAPDPVQAFYLERQLAVLDFGIERERLAARAAEVVQTLDLPNVRSVLPNSGPIPLAEQFSSPRDVLSTMQRGWQGSRRRFNEDFAGFSPDDAVFDEDFELWQLWSNARLSAFLASVALEGYANPKVLELGCGPAFLFFFLTRYGIKDYLGIDGNPLILRFLRHVRGQDHHFRLLNLEQQIRLEQRSEPIGFDVLVSFEVLEHLREEALPAFLATVRTHMHQRSVAFVTASKLAPEEIDTHVTGGDRATWLRRFADAGLLPARDAEELCDELLRRHPWNWDDANTYVFALTLAEPSSDRC